MTGAVRPEVESAGVKGEGGVRRVNVGEGWCIRWICMRLATPRSTPRDDPNHHYLWVIVGMLYVSQGSAGELRGGERWRRERWRRGLCRCSGGGGREDGGPRMGGGAVAARAYIARTNPNGNSSLGGASPIMHTPVLTGRSCSRSLSFSPAHLLFLFHVVSISLFLAFTPSPSSPGFPSSPITQRFHRLLHSILDSTQLQRNRRAILGDKVTS